MIWPEGLRFWVRAHYLYKLHIYIYIYIKPWARQSNDNRLVYNNICSRALWCLVWTSFRRRAGTHVYSYITVTKNAGLVSGSGGFCLHSVYDVYITWRVRVFKTWRDSSKKGAPNNNIPTANTRGPITGM